MGEKAPDQVDTVLKDSDLHAETDAVRADNPIVGGEAEGTSDAPPEQESDAPAEPGADDPMPAADDLPGEDDAMPEVPETEQTPEEGEPA